MNNNNDNNKNVNNNQKLVKSCQVGIMNNGSTLGDYLSLGQQI